MKKLKTSLLTLTVLAGFAMPVSASDIVEPGKEVQCLDLNSMRSTTPVSNETIAVKLTQDRFARIDLKNRCTSLKIEGGFSYSTSLTKLCKQDTLTVIRAGTPCIMEKIVGITEAEYDELLASR